MSVGEGLHANRALWDAWTDIHVNSEFYDLAAFLAGSCSLLPVEVEEVGPVQGLELLHTQCHFGMDTLSWARRGARVTGLDFSPRAIAFARQLSCDTNLQAEFIEANVLELPTTLHGRFDLVFTSAGVLCWLHDLKAWARNLTACIKPGGRLYLREFHPAATMLDMDTKSLPAALANPYFRQQEPSIYPVEGSYADANAEVSGTSYEWEFGLADVIQAVLDAGLRLVFFHEHNYLPYRSHGFLVRRDDGMYVSPEPKGGLPLMFSLCAVKEVAK